MSVHTQGESIPVVGLPVTVHRVAIFAATSWEIEAILDAGDGVERTRVAGFAASMFPCAKAWVYVVSTGIGPKRATQVAQAVLSEARWDAVISAGFAGGLRSDETGSVLIGTGATAFAPGITQGLPKRGGVGHPSLVRIARAAAKEWAGRCRAGAFLSTDFVVWRANDKAALAGLYDAIAIDMESAALAEISERVAVPFLIVRTVSDRVTDSLPMDFNLFLHKAGRMYGWGQVLAYTLSHPSSTAGLLRLARQSRIAGRQLTGFFRLLLPHLVRAEGATQVSES